MGSARSERLDHQFSVFRPSQCYCVQRVPLRRKPDVAGEKSPAVQHIQPTAGDLGRGLAVYGKRPGGVYRLAVERHPGAASVEESELVVIGPAMAGQRYVQQQIAILADDIR